jgi:uncharacterized membrane protein
MKIYSEELLHYKLFEFNWSLIFTVNHFIFFSEQSEIAQRKILLSDLYKV